ncbi:DUF2079 domain-containing protein [Leptospira sp. 2 VSF19]|uniref:DUF2079 domain-containing protein n=1 Tax=Leptospira soteropolitanensis TaxID=2950025 RepID=A0AAW5VIS6_9LEPT|nr:DUF2079 domain-containing protein [Leptospira soteropolitanensis]MCW7491894.1 DUF2079 domain-containing protein [Leptospira soteropolitanensis]MCW7499478.1 DUF2079 domain-containing protein [Leptospira soteropolitanensis]MCW7520931.1 DUF2079 domain-containing protein [Leptospira soteropolitanensis]MCW7525582.1 DUF2079 domain-containing protein [Leptospira soteropolitanensis]MCW7529448.1 DUF2079 domain-containing protein [Leptospira soteropolitanensis]
MKRLRYHLPSFLLWLVVFYFLSERSIFRYQHMGAGVDIGLFENLFYNLIHQGKAITSLGVDGNNHHYFADHINWFIYPLYLLYYLFPYVESLLIFQALVLSIPILIFPFYKWEKSYHLVYPFLYTLFLPIYWIQIFDFHPEVLWIPLFFLFYYFWKKKSKYWVLFFALSLLVKEECALVWIIFALVILRKNPKESLFIGTLSLLYFLFSIFLLSKMQDSITNLSIPTHWERYKNPIGALQNLHLFPYLFLFLNLPFLFLQFKNKLILCLLPYLFYSILSSYEVNKTPFTHHSFIAVPILFICFIEIVETFNRKKKYLFCFTSLLVSIALFVWFGPLSKTYSYKREFMNPGLSTKDVSILRNLLEGKSIVSNIPQYLSNRNQVQLFLSNKTYSADYFVFYQFQNQLTPVFVPKEYKLDKEIEKHIQIYKYKKID